MALTDYTTYAEIRAVLGVDAKELPDATLALGVYSRGLDAALLDIDTDLPADFDTVAAIAEGTRTTVQGRLYDAVSLFAPYGAAVQLASSLPLFAPKTITDGKAGVTRDASSPYKATIAKCAELFSQYRQNLIDRYAEYVGSTATVVLRPFFSVASPSTDPVTG